MHKKHLQFRTDAPIHQDACAQHSVTLIQPAFLSRRTPLAGAGRRALLLIHELSGSFAPLGLMQLALDVVLSCDACGLLALPPTGLLTAISVSPLAAAQAGEEERNRTAIVPFPNRGYRTDHG
jgi:hypothetical protein